jgi:hypothetical protein
MDVINLLPNHPMTPQRHRLETLLPDLAAKAVRNKTFYCPYEFTDSPVARIADQVEVVRHQHIGDKFTWPFVILVIEFL